MNPEPIEYELRNPHTDFPSYYKTLCARAADEIQRLQGLQKSDNKSEQTNNMHTFLHICGWIFIAQIIFVVIGLLVCHLCSNRIKKTDTPVMAEWSLQDMLLELTVLEGNAVLILPMDPEGDYTVRVVEVTSDWTKYEPVRFTGVTLQEATRSAWEAKRKWDARSQ